MATRRPTDKRRAGKSTQPRRKQRRVRQPGPRSEPTRQKRFELEHRDPALQKKIEELLVRVCQQAAREARELEAHQVVELHRRDRELAEAYAEARSELMATLRRWEATRERRDPD